MASPNEQQPEQQYELDPSAPKKDTEQKGILEPSAWWKRPLIYLILLLVATGTQLLARTLIPDANDWRRWALIVVVALGGGILMRRFLGR